MKKSGSTKSHFIIGIVIAFFLLVGTVLISVQVKSVIVTGSSHYTDQQMTELIFQTNMDWNSAYCYFKDRMQEHVQIPFVEDYDIVFHGPTKVEIIVYEKSIVGYVSFMGSNMYFDKDGIIVESTSETLDDIPCVSGLSFGYIVLHKPLPVEDNTIFQQISDLTQILAMNQLEVDEIHYTSDMEPVLYIEEIEVILGSSGNVNDKIAVLSDMLPGLSGESGTLYLDTYDAANANHGSTFKKKLQNY